MEIFLDTANLQEISEAVKTGCVDGITTNPTLIAKEQIDPVRLIPRICELVSGPVNVEVLSTEVAGMIEEALWWSAVHSNVVVKLPMTAGALAALKKIKIEMPHIKINMTLIFSAVQGLLAAKVGADYISPFVGRLDDCSQNGMVVVKDLVEIFRNYPRIKTRVLAASIRHPIHVVEAAKAGAQIVTMPYEVFKKLYSHPLTDIGLAKFLEDAKKIKR